MGTNHLVDELYGISVDFKFYLTQLATSVVLLLLLRDGERWRERELLNKDSIRGPNVFDTRQIISLNILCFQNFKLPQKLRIVKIQSCSRNNNFL